MILPAKFRADFERGGYLTEHREGCLALWTPGEFERQMAAMQERAARAGPNRNRARLWAPDSHEVEVDRQGRMAIPCTCGNSPRWRATSWSPGPSTGSSCGTRPVWESSVQPDERWFLEDEDE